MSNPNGNPENLTPFTKDRQPTSEQKKRGWERKREAQKILDEFMKQGEMTYKEIEDLLADIKEHPENHTVREVKIARYLSKEKFTTDWLDRHVSKAPQQVDMTTGGQPLSNIKFVFTEDGTNQEDTNKPEAETSTQDS